jgi:hypothetical protein
MENSEIGYLFRAEMWLLVTTLIYFIMNGAGIFETAVIVPKWTSNPPDSMKILGGEYGIDLKFFWIIMHSIHEITFIVAIVFCWHIPGVREWLLFLFASHFGIRVWTLAYFAPNIMAFQAMVNTNVYDANLKERANRWKNLNYIRTGLFIAISLGLVAVFLQVIAMG